MRLFQLTGIEYPDNKYDIALAFVVCAKDELQARLLASKQAGDEGPDFWLDSDKSMIRPLRAIGDARVVLRDFHNG